LSNLSLPTRDTDEDGPVLTTVDAPQLINPSSPVRGTDEESAAVPTTVDETRLSNHSSPTCIV